MFTVVLHSLIDLNQVFYMKDLLGKKPKQTKKPPNNQIKKKKSNKPIKTSKTEKDKKGREGKTEKGRKEGETLA